MTGKKKIINPFHNNTSFRDIWHNYRSEVAFLLILSSLTVISHILSRFIPVDFFNNVLTPVQNSFTIAVCLFGACVMFLHSDGLRIRKTWAWTLTAWGVADTFFLLQTYVFNNPVLHIGSSALTAYMLLAGNFLGWLLLVYPTEALQPGWLNWKNVLWQLLPMVALVGLDYITDFNLAPLIALYPVVLFILVLSHIRAYRIWCEENYSSMDHIDVQWIVRYLFMLLVIGGSYLYMNLTKNPVRAFTQQWLLFLLFGYSTEQILFRRNPWDNLTSNNQEDNPDSAGNLTDNADMASSEMRALTSKLEQWMESEKPYLNPDFRLMDLRSILPMNRTYLSQLIHNAYGCTFYQFINRYRIDYAKQLMRENPNMKIADIATQSGFSSQSIFSQIFSKETGMSPREWSKNFYKK